MIPEFLFHSVAFTDECRRGLQQSDEQEHTGKFHVV
jgi:hypothetical protein